MQTILDKQESFDVKNPLSKIASANIVEKTVSTLFDNENKNKEDMEA